MARFLIIYHHSDESTDYLEVELETVVAEYKIVQELFAEWIESRVHEQCRFEDHEYYDVYIDHVFRIDTKPIKDMGICTQIEGGRITEEVEDAL